MGLIRDRDRTRQRILDAAAREFAARGYDATTMSAVARRGKVSKQLLQHHFPPGRQTNIQPAPRRC